MAPADIGFGNKVLGPVQDAPEAGGSIGDLIAAGVLFLVGCGILAHGLSGLKKSMAASLWPATPGSIQSCEVAKRPIDRGDASPPDFDYLAEVKYSYFLDGRVYRREHFAYAYSGSGSEAASANICTQLRSASSVEVRYDPNDHNEAFLGWGPSQDIVATLYFGTWVLLCSCLLAVAQFRWGNGILEDFRLDLMAVGKKVAVLMFIALLFLPWLVERIYLHGLPVR